MSSEYSDDLFLKLAADVFCVDPAVLSLSTSYGQLPQWDSVNHIRLIMEFERLFAIQIPLEMMPQICSLNDFKKFCRSHG